MNESLRAKLKTDAVERLRELSEEVLSHAKSVMRDLEKAGKTVALKPEGDGILVSPPPVPEDLADRIRQHRAEIIELLKTGPQVWLWKPEDFLITVSLAANGVRDFVMGPPVPGLIQFELDKTTQKIFLDAAPESWRKQIAGMGGLVGYPASQFDALRKAVSDMNTKAS